MTADEVIGRLRDKLGNAVLETSVPDKRRVYVTVEADSIDTAADVIFSDLGGRFVINSGTDQRRSTGRYLISHFFAFDDADIYLALHTYVDEDDPRLPSITPYVPGAGWGEREFRDMVGVEPVNHPDPRRLVLPDDWPEGVYPLRCDFDHDSVPAATPDAQPHFHAPPDGATTVPIGPFYPVLEEPAHFRIFVDGERVVGADYRGFYNHRGIEKLGCSTLTYNQIPFIAERICGICGFVHSTCYCQAVEEAAGIEVPARDLLLSGGGGGGRH